MIRTLLIYQLVIQPHYNIMVGKYLISINRCWLVIILFKTLNKEELGFTRALSKDSSIVTWLRVQFSLV